MKTNNNNKIALEQFELSFMYHKAEGPMAQ